MRKFSATILMALAGGMVQAGVMHWQVGAHEPEVAGSSWAMARVHVAEGRIDTGYDVWDGDGWNVPETSSSGGVAWFDSAGYATIDPEFMFVNELVDDCLDALVQAPAKSGDSELPEKRNSDGVTVASRQDGPKIAVSNFHDVVPTSYIFWNGELVSVPEPSGGLMALFGGALLLLRRKRL